MQLFSWLRPLVARFSRTPGANALRLARRRAPQRPAFRPGLETLEDRLTPSGGGLLDPTFDGDGVRTLPQATCNLAVAVAVQPEGKIVSVGQNADGIAVVRMNANGSLDTSFNGTGLVTLKVAHGAYGKAVALQP